MTSRSIGCVRRRISRSPRRLVVCCAGRPMETPLRAQGPDIGTEAQRESGKALYGKYCSQCHGEKGDGQGYATPHLYSRAPRLHDGQVQGSDDAQRSAPDTSGPRQHHRRGMPYTSMPAWPNLTDQEVSDIAYFITTFSADFTNRRAYSPAHAVSKCAGRHERDHRAREKLYEENGCLKCHGNLGRGDGPSAPTLVDDFAKPIRAADLSQRWTFRGGSSREDIFRTMTTGLNGTPMPSFADALQPEQRWAITDFIASLSSEDGPGYTNLVVAKYALDPIDLTKGAASFESAPVARFPIIGQITEPGRQFHPPATSVRVQAIYDAESIALLVRWHDMRADNTGKNDPTLVVPIEEEEEARGRPIEGGDQIRRPSSGRSGRPLCGNGSGADRPAIGVQRRGRDPDSERSPDGRAQAVLHLRRRPELRRSLVLRSGPPRAPSVHRPGKRGPCAERYGGCHRCRELRPGRMVGHLQAAASRELGRPVHARRVPAGRLLGVGRILARSWQQARSHGLVFHLRRAEVVPSPLGPMVRTALLILVIELVVIGLVRWRHRPWRRGEFGGEPSHPAATRV